MKLRSLGQAALVLRVALLCQIVAHGLGVLGQRVSLGQLQSDADRYHASNIHGSQQVTALSRSLLQTGALPRCSR